MSPAAHADTGSAPAVQPPRALKLVVTLRPHAGSPLAAVLAVGADGCDPIIRSLAVDDLQAALAALSILVAEAEARWADRPRYPVAAPHPDRRQPARQHPPSNASPPRVGTTTITADAPTRQPDPAERRRDEPVVAPPATTAQLSFFEQS